MSDENNLTYFALNYSDREKNAKFYGGGVVSVNLLQINIAYAFLQEYSFFT